MGIIASKIFKDVKSKAEESIRGATTEGTTESEDARSTASAQKTPVTIEKLNHRKDFNSEDKLITCETKLLRSLKFDPRSPTVGIYRTPILVEEVDSNNKKSDNFNSPVSIYSCNLSDSILQDVMTPPEPSVNVSGFEKTQLNDSVFNVTLEEAEATNETEITENARPLKIIDRPNTYEARKLLDEIVLSDEENFLKRIKMPSNKEKKLSSKISRKKLITDSKVNHLKSRPPLSNITSSANSPNQMNTSLKAYCRHKVLPEYGPENNVSPKVQCLMQWDRNTTVII